MVRNSRVTALFRGHNEDTGDQKGLRPYTDIVSVGTCFNAYHSHVDLMRSTESETHDYPPTHQESSIREWTLKDDYETDVAYITDPGPITLALRDLVVESEEPRPFRILPDSLFRSEATSHLESVPCGDSDCPFADMGTSTCQSQQKSSLPYLESASGLQSRCSSSGSHHCSLYTEDPELGTTRTTDSHSIGSDWPTILEVSESGYFTNTEGSLVQRQLDPPRSGSRETSLIHLPSQLPSQDDPPTVACRELVLYSQYPRAWEVDDLAAAWRCFVQPREGKRWVAYGIVGIAVVLGAVLTNFLSSGLQKYS
jgi:hypothetical protein